MGPRPTSSRDSMIGPDASALGSPSARARRPRRAGSACEQVVQVLALLRGDAGELRRPSPLLGLEASAARSDLIRSTFASGRSILLTATTIGTSAARVRDRLARLRYDAVVGGDDEDGDVGHLRAAGAHLGERLVTGRVDERDLAPVRVDLVRADVLRDPAGLGLDDLRPRGSRRGASSCHGRRGP